MRGHDASTSTEGAPQIPERALAADPADLDALLGAWWREVPALAHSFAASGAVPHVVIDDFFAEPAARALRAAFPSDDAPLWHVYDNPLERKRACSDTARMPPCLRDALFALCAPSVVEAMRSITGLAPCDGLQADPFCHGGGLHAHGRGGKLDLHLDYSIHPRSGLERRFNLIVYLTPEPWDSTYGGALELWAPTAQDPSLPATLEASVQPRFNRALLFATTGPSFHGFPRPLACPEAVRRTSLALYYLTPPRPCAPPRSKALYVAAPGEAHDIELERLRALRATRRLEPADLAGGELGRAVCMETQHAVVSPPPVEGEA